MSKIPTVILAIILSVNSIYAQVDQGEITPVIPGPPINMETMAGTRGVHYQMIINKKFQSLPKLGFFSVTHGTASWEQDMTPDIMTQAHLTYSLFKGLDVSAGMQYSPIYAFRPVAGLIYSYASPDLTLILNPKVDLADDLATESMALIEYKPRLNDNLRFYSRVQGLYGFVPESGVHNRSYLVLRAGITYKEFTFGVGSNFDWYGPVKQNENSVGLFVSVLLF